MPDANTLRFLTIPDVAEELAATNIQVRSLIKTGDLPAIQIGGRGQWRIERSKLEEYIANAYLRAEQTVADEAAKKEQQQEIEPDG